MHTDNNKDLKSIENSSALAHQLSFGNLHLKLDHHTRDNWFMQGPKQRKENKLLSLKHSCWSYKYIWVISTRGNCEEHRRHIRLFPTCQWLFPTCHLSPCVPQTPLTATPSLPTGGLPELELNGKRPLITNHCTFMVPIDFQPHLHGSSVTIDKHNNNLTRNLLRLFCTSKLKSVGFYGKLKVLRRL